MTKMIVRYQSYDMYQIIYGTRGIRWDSKTGLLTAIAGLGIQGQRKAIKTLDFLLIEATKQPFRVIWGTTSN